MVKSSKWTERYFAKRLRTERDRRGWTQAELAERLGVGMHWTTIAKIEKGTRSVRIDEAALIADIFETSVDAMLGRKVQRADDVDYALGALLETAQQSSMQVAGIRNSLAERFTELNALELDGIEELREVAGKVDHAFRVVADGLARIALYRKGEALPKGEINKLYTDSIRATALANAKGEK